MSIEKLSSATVSPAPPQDKVKLIESARQFEALLIAQMLRSARESGGGWMGSGEDETSSATVGMAEEHLAQTLAQQGGLGLSTMIVEGLTKDQIARSQKEQLVPKV
jgi:Rod binding domain-containing protein